MFKYDSTHGPYKGTIKVIDKLTLEIDGKVSVTSNRYPIGTTELFCSPFAIFII